MKYQFIIVTVFITFSYLNATSQTFLKIDSSENIFRYYSESVENLEKINDSVTVKISKKRGCYTFKVYNSAKLVDRCYYSESGKISSEVIKQRVFDKSGETFKMIERKVIFLSPTILNCMEKYLIKNAEK